MPPLHGSDPQAIGQVDGLVQALVRRSGQHQSSTPEWIHLHDLVAQEIDLLQAEGAIPGAVTITLNLQAARDLLFGVYSDFTEVLGHLLGHGLAGGGRQITMRTWGGQSHFRLEIEDDGDAIDPVRACWAA